MRRRNLLVFILLLALCGSAGAVRATGWEFSPAFDLRVRQETLDGVYHFDRDQDTDRNWIRARTRAGATLAGQRHAVELRLTNEHRHFLHQDIDFDWDELIIDRLAWSWQVSETGRLTLGRQDIIWPGGFLMLEGHPLDGSRSMYHNAVRYRASSASDELDLALIRNPRRDDFVLVGDEKRVLTNAEETGLAGRWNHGSWSASLIWKYESMVDDSSDMKSFTIGSRYATRSSSGDGLEGEFALQHQTWGNSSAMPDGPDWTANRDGWALAGHGIATFDLGDSRTIALGGFYYSGRGEHLEAFRAPWGSWPKWSELYIYTLIDEATSDRVHVAAWENIAALRIELRGPLVRILDRQLRARLSAAYLLAPVPEWKERGLLTQAEVTCDLGPCWKSHVLWERLEPGSFHNRAGDLSPLTETIHFLRWQLTYAYR